MLRDLFLSLAKAFGYIEPICSVKLEKPIPWIKKYGVPYSYMLEYYEHIGIEPMMESDEYILNKFVYTTNNDGWAEVLPYLVLDSSLYKPDKFMCWGYALKAMILCHELFGLTTFLMAMQFESVLDMERAAGHAYNIFPVWDEYAKKFESKPMLFEPNDAYEYAGNAFNLGENKYNPSEIFAVGR